MLIDVGNNIPDQICERNGNDSFAVGISIIYHDQDLDQIANREHIFTITFRFPIRTKFRGKLDESTDIVIAQCEQTVEIAGTMMETCKQIRIWCGISTYKIRTKMNGDPFEHFIISIIISHQMKIVIRQKNKGTKGNIVFLTVNEHIVI